MLKMYTILTHKIAQKCCKSGMKTSNTPEFLGVFQHFLIQLPNFRLKGSLNRWLFRLEFVE